MAIVSVGGLLISGKGVLLIHPHRTYYYRARSRLLVEQYSVEWWEVYSQDGLESTILSGINSN